MQKYQCDFARYIITLHTTIRNRYLEVDQGAVISNSGYLENTSPPDVNVYYYLNFNSLEKF